MQIRCNRCGRAVTLAATGALPERCPHCDAEPVPRVLGRYVIERLLAAGGMGEVYVARHRQLETRVAIKLLPRGPGGKDFERLRERFLREAKLTASIGHPGVVGVLDFEEDGDRAFLVLELVAGESLRAQLNAAGGRLAVEEAVRITLGVADVLRAAHARGVVHRDIKPENVIVSREGAVRVLDFGIARAWQDDEPLTRTGEVLGTPEYMAPEQLLEAGDSIDARADVHALGVMLHELLTGTSPFRGANLFQALKLVESYVPPTPSRARPEVPAEVDAVVVRALAKSPGDRHADAGAFADALLSAMPIATTGRESIRTPSRPTAAPLALAILVAVVAFVLGRAFASRSTPTQAAIPSAAELAAARLDDARRALLAGEFHAALAMLEPSLRTNSIAAIELASVAWVCSQYMLPTVLRVPQRWLDSDRVRRDRILGIGAEAREAQTPMIDACRRLALGDSAGALAVLGASSEPSPNEVHALLRLLAARLACADRTVFSRAADRWRPREPGTVWELLVSSDEELRGALEDHVAQLEVHFADRWLAGLCVEHLRAVESGRGVERLRAHAELAWLTGAGEIAPIWFAALRIDLASADPRFAIDAEEAQRVLALLHGFDAKDHPALPWLESLLRTAMGESVDLAERLFDVSVAADPVRKALMTAIAKKSIGRTVDAHRELESIPTVSGDAAGDARLVMAMIEQDPAVAVAHWRTAIAAGADLSLLDWLPPRVSFSRETDVLPNGATAATSWLPPLRCLVRMTGSAQSLLERDTLRAFREPPLRDAWIREVQGGLDL